MTYDDDDGKEYDAPPPNAERARKSLAAPGMILILFGLLGLIVETASIGYGIAEPFWIYDLYRGFVAKNLPAGKPRDDALAQLDSQKADMRADSPLNIGGGVLGFILNAVMLAGGLRMRALKSYGLAIAAAICGVIPMSGCSCFAMPIGIWALVVLCNSDVKRAFETVRRSG